ncbi:hypothetical protein TSUD_142980 [Trifolium subterraneum]|uniref:Uncharacterized protein n=1 Tax=Trifolium subterraneum TaxID=3900 RepID=A0A2Z6NGU4_TRISU|nr:hypothetical protein TSUD_142980 [Trifolium subterraneum]
MALSKNFIIVFGIVCTLLLYISSNAALASRQLSDCDSDVAQNDSCSGPTLDTSQGQGSGPAVETSQDFKDPPSEASPCKGGGC